MFKRILFVLTILIIITSCSSSEVKRNENISKTYIWGYNKLIIEYNNIERVELDGIPIISGETYYVKKNEYILSYTYRPKVTFEMSVSYKRDDRGSDNYDKDLVASRSIEEKLYIDKDTYLKLEDKNFEVQIKGEVGN